MKSSELNSVPYILTSKQENRHQLNQLRYFVPDASCWYLQRCSLMNLLLSTSLFTSTAVYG